MGGLLLLIGEVGGKGDGCVEDAGGGEGGDVEFEDAPSQTGGPGMG